MAPSRQSIISTRRMSESFYKALSTIAIALLVVAMVTIAYLATDRVDQLQQESSSATSASSKPSYTTPLPPVNGSVFIPSIAGDDKSGTTGKLFEGKRVALYDQPHLFGASMESLVSKYGGKPTVATALGSQMNCEKWSVVTTINPPTLAVQRQAAIKDWCIVVVGDKKGPFTYPMEGVDENHFIFLTAEKQEKLGEEFPLVKLLPWNHFGRKNVGFLYAISRGAKVIYDFDDDNCLLSKHHTFHMPGTHPHLKNQNVSNTATEDLADSFQAMEPVSYNYSVLNPYPLLGATIDPSWPRGYPLEMIKPTYFSHARELELKTVSIPMKHIGVIQYMANHDPDVDAIYRMTQHLPLDFPVRGHHPIVLPQGPQHHHVYTPYNAQATLHLYNSLWSLLLPISVHGRVSDIWRSYFAQRIMADVGIRIAFHPPVVIQERNVHNYLADFDSELPLYKESFKLVQQLDVWASCAPTIVGRIEELWIMLYEHGYIGEKDVSLVQGWLHSLIKAGYQFPVVNTPKDCKAQEIDRRLRVAL